MEEEEVVVVVGAAGLWMFDFDIQENISILEYTKIIKIHEVFHFVKLKSPGTQYSRGGPSPLMSINVD